MAVVGEAHIVVRAITNQVKDDIRRGFDGSKGEGGRAGRSAGDEYQKGFGKSMRRSRGMFSGIRQEALQASDAFDRLVVTGYALGPAIVALVGALGGAAAGLFAIGAQAAAAGPALLALVNVFGALAQGGIVLKSVFSGIGAAIGAAGQAGGGGGRSAAAAAKAVEAAQKRIKDAQKRVAQVEQANAKRLEAANDAILRAEDGVKEAKDEVTAATERVAEAEAEEREALEAVNEAREEARESLQQLRFELEDAVLSEQRAALGLEDARNELARVANLPPNNRQRREAELAFAEAELRLRRAKDNTNDTAKEVEERNAKGIEGSDEVVAALDRQKDAEKRVSDAKDAVIAANEKVLEAEESLTDAINERNAVIAENKTRLEEAKQAVKDARDALEDAKKGGEGAGGGVDKFAEAMSKLAPAAQEFVGIALDIKNEFDGIKKAAQQEFFSVINDDVQELANNYLPLLQRRFPETAEVLGKAGEKILGVFNLPENQNRIDRVFGSNNRILDDIGGAVSNLANSFLILLDNLRPLAEEFSDWILKLTDGWNNTLIADDKSGKLSKTLDYAGGVAKRLGRIFGNLFGAIKNIGEAAAGPGSGGEKLLGLLEGVTGRWERFTGSVEGQNRLEDFFNNIVPMVSEFGGLIGDIFKAFFTTAEQGAEGEEGGPLAGLIRSLREVVRILSEEMGPEMLGVLPTVGKMLEDAAAAFSNLTSSGAIESFFGVLGAFANAIKGLTGNPIFMAIFSIVAPAFAVAKAFSLIFKLLRFIFFGAVLGKIIKWVGTFKKVQSIISKLRFAFLVLRLALLLFAGPIAIIIGIVTGLVAIFVAMWRESEVFRNAIRKLIYGVMEKAIEIFFRLKQKLDEALEPLMKLIKPVRDATKQVDIFKVAIDFLRKAFKWLGDIIGKYVVPFFEFTFKNALDIIIAPIEFVIELIGNLIGAFEKIFTGISQGDIGMVFEGIVEAITAPFRALWDTLVELFKGIFNNIIDLVKDLLGISSPSQVFADIGQAIIDGLINILTFFPRKFLEIFTGAWDLVDDYFFDTVLPFIKDLPNRFLNGLKKLWDGFIDLLELAWKGVVAYFTTVGKIYLFIINLPIKFGKWLRGLWDSFYDFLFGEEGIWNKVKAAFEPGGAVSNWFSGLKNKIATLASGMWDGVASAFKSAINALLRIWNGLKLELKFPDSVFGIPLGPLAGRGFTLDPPFIDYLAQGGLVRPSRGGTLAVIGEAGRSERVEPLDPDGLSKRDKAMINFLTGGAGGGTTINVYPAPGMDERELAEKVSRELAFMMRRGTL